MTEKTLASAVSEAVTALLTEHREIAQDAIMAMLPAHVRSARPSMKIIKAAVVAAGWRSVKGRDDIMMFRAPQADSDPLAQHGDNEAGEQLRLLIERIERLEEEKKGISDDIKDVYGEANSTGFDVKTIRSIVRLRKMEKHTRDEQEALLDLYKTVLGLD